MKLGTLYDFEQILFKIIQNKYFGGKLPELSRQTWFFDVLCSGSYAVSVVLVFSLLFLQRLPSFSLKAPQIT
jgi:hypothetical protein